MDRLRKFWREDGPFDWPVLSEVEGLRAGYSPRCRIDTPILKIEVRQHAERAEKGSSH